MNNLKKNKPDMEIDLSGLAKEIFSKMWLVIFCGMVTGAIVFFGATAFLSPKYEAKVHMYVNNMENSAEVNNVSYADITASIMLANTCSKIISSDTVLNDVIEETGTKIPKDQLQKMLTTEPVTDTEIIEITMKGQDQKEITYLVNVIAEVSADKLTEIIEGSSVKILNQAEIPTKPTGLGYLKLLVLGILFGCFCSVFVISMRNIFDVRVKSEKDLEYWGYPVLGVVPDMLNVSNRRSYYKKD